MSSYNPTLQIDHAAEERLSQSSAFLLWLTLSAGGWSLLLRLM